MLLDVCIYIRFVFVVVVDGFVFWMWSLPHYTQGTLAKTRECVVIHGLALYFHLKFVSRVYVYCLRLQKFCSRLADSSQITGLFGRLINQLRGMNVTFILRRTMVLLNKSTAVYLLCSTFILTWPLKQICLVSWLTKQTVIYARGSYVDIMQI